MKIESELIGNYKRVLVVILRTTTKSSNNKRERNYKLLIQEAPMQGSVSDPARQIGGQQTGLRVAA